VKRVVQDREPTRATWSWEVAGAGEVSASKQAVARAGNVVGTFSESTAELGEK